MADTHATRGGGGGGCGDGPTAAAGAPAVIRLADNTLASVGTRVVATGPSSRGHYDAGDVGLISRLNHAGPFVRWDRNGAETQASTKRLQHATWARLSDGRPACTGLRVEATTDLPPHVRQGDVGCVRAVKAAAVATPAPRSSSLDGPTGTSVAVTVEWDGPPCRVSSHDPDALRSADGRLLRLATFNIGTRCQSLQVAGSEAGTVIRMRAVRAW